MEIKENTIYTLYRRGEKEHNESLFNNGDIYINTVSTIRQYDDNLDRSDPHDCISNREYIGEAQVKICNYGLDINVHGFSFNANDLLLTDDSNPRANIYCLSGIYTKHLIGKREDIQFNTSSFGESLIIIHNPKEFIHRILQELKISGFTGVKYGVVKYYANNYTGKIGAFRKHERFSFQNEFRIFIPNEHNVLIRLCIGPLEDIAQLYQERGCCVKLSYTDDKEQLMTII